MNDEPKARENSPGMQIVMSLPHSIIDQDLVFHRARERVGDAVIQFVETVDRIFVERTAAVATDMWNRAATLAERFQEHGMTDKIASELRAIADMPKNPDPRIKEIARLAKRLHEDPEFRAGQQRFDDAVRASLETLEPDEARSAKSILGLSDQ